LSNRIPRSVATLGRNFAISSSLRCSACCVAFKLALAGQRDGELCGEIIVRLGQSKRNGLIYQTEKRRTKRISKSVVCQASIGGLAAAVISCAANLSAQSERKTAWV